MFSTGRRHHPFCNFSNPCIQCDSCMKCDVASTNKTGIFNPKLTISVISEHILRKNLLLSWSTSDLNKPESTGHLPIGTNPKRRLYCPIVNCVASLKCFQLQSIDLYSKGYQYKSKLPAFIRNLAFLYQVLDIKKCGKQKEILENIRPCVDVMSQVTSLQEDRCSR